MVGLDWVGLVGEVNGQVIGRAAAGPTIPLPCHAAAQCWRCKVTHIHTLHAAIAGGDNDTGLFPVFDFGRLRAGV